MIAFSGRFNIAIFLIIASTSISANPVEDRQQIRAFYQQLFPQLSLDDYAEGVYAIDADAKDSWLAIEEFPPYEFALERGELLFNQAFANGSGYADCFANKGIAIAQNHPYWDKQKQQITTLANAINDCRQKNQLPPLAYAKGEITTILAYMAYTSRGQRINTQIPAESQLALTAYQQGKAYFYQRRGQLNFSCASCHLDNAGKFIRSEILSPALGHTTHWPAYRLNSGEMGTLHRRFMVCNKLIRAKVDPAQSTALRQLEYFLSFIDNGLPLNGPSTRK
ncbi:sulfur oxidation c-type cytochrome SoxA [Methylococcaceae bacterium HT1]|nr:sulfur oxidation c-type cytochrome SoxA [Methylococcaceae bacterium HT1]TXL18604.1 sulfur oxidation c-type cytochrome SoxA [Methylococcaceae bacterium HT3]TXL23564.1 sulfur oxidation c-type cytochrome SoxA [Methylococcaceae bacterium HT2]